jgi:hypothetical protein
MDAIGPTERETELEVGRPPVAAVAARDTVDLCESPRCADGAAFTCAFRGRDYCAEHGSGVTICKLFRLRTDWPEELVDLLSGISDPRARIWLCQRCQHGAPVYRQMDR